MSDAQPIASALSTLGPCPTCGSERLIRVEMERAPGMFGLEVVHYVDCGKCPTIRIQLLPAGDQPSPPSAPPT